MEGMFTQKIIKLLSIQTIKLDTSHKNAYLLKNEALDRKGHA